MKKRLKTLLCSCCAAVMVFAMGSAVFAADQETMPPAAPEKIVFVIQAKNDPDSGKPMMTWEPVPDAVKYVAYRSTNQYGTYAKKYTTTATSYTNVDAVSGKKYYYKVRAFDKEGNIIVTSSSVARVCDLPRPVVSVGNQASNGKPVISWKKVAGAEKYVVYKATSRNGKYSSIITTAKTSVTHLGAGSGKQYYYKVFAVDADDAQANSAYSKIVTRVCDLARPVISLTANSSGYPKLTWKKVYGAEKYEIYRKTGSKGTYKRIYTVRGTVFTNISITFGNTYYYQVRAIDADDAQANSAKSKAKYIKTFNPKWKMVALTFDDGPGPYTKKIVNCLKNNGAKATFYVLGERIEYYPDEIKAIASAGSEIGNHSYSHPMLYSLSASGIQSQMSRTDTAVKKLTGETPATMRPPGGGFNATVRKNVGKPMILWNVDTLDWKTRSKQATINCVMKEVSDGDIILMHDIHKPTMEAALELIPMLKKKGYHLVTVSELAKYKGVKLKNGEDYYCF